MFDVTISVSALQSTVRALAAIVDEATFAINEDGLSANAVDPANAALAAITISEGAFIEYDVSEAELGIDLRRMVEIIGMAGKDDVIKLDLDEHTHKLRIGMGGLEYTMALLDPVSMRKSAQVPELELPAEIILSSNKFKQMIKAAGMIGDNMKIGVDGENVYMEAIGDSDAVRLDLTTEDLISLRSAQVSGTYSLDYLNDISKGIGAASEITINLGRDLPVVIDFVPYPRCDVTYLLAPRIDPE